jgi:anti-sigma factor (TIGR02949 family)
LSGTDCDDVLRDIEHYLHGELDPERHAALKAHLQGCSPCFHRAEFQRKLKEIVRSKCRSEAPATLVERVRMSLRAQPRGGRGAQGPGRP